MQKLIRSLFAASAFLIASTSAIAAPTATNVDATITAGIGRVLPGVVLEKITKTPYAGLYELVTPEGIFYTDQTGSFMIAGAAIIDSATRVNLTAKRFEELGQFNFKDLPLGDAIKTVKGDGSRVFATFEDPNCGFCKKLMHEFAKLDNVTIYTFLIPVLSPDSATKSKDIWCAQDRSKAWAAQMMENVSASTAPAQCTTPIERNLALSKKLRVVGTPAILFASNVRLPGYVTADKIEEKLK